MYSKKKDPGYRIPGSFEVSINRVMYFYPYQINGTKCIFQHTNTIYPSPIQTILSALDSHQVHHSKNSRMGHGLRTYVHHRRLGISPDPEGIHYSFINVIENSISQYNIILW